MALDLGGEDMMAIPMIEPLWEHLEFPVSLQMVLTQTPGGKTIGIPKVRSVFREDSGEVLDLVSDGYTLIPHGEIFRPLHSLVVGGDFPVKVTQVRTSVGMGGGYARLEWLFDETVEVVPGDQVQISLLAHNSLDRSASLRCELSARRLLCSNGMRGPGPEFWRAWLHRGNLSIPEIFGWIKGIFHQVPVMVERWQQWSQRRIFVERVKEFLETDSQTSGIMGKRAREGVILRLGKAGDRKKVSVWEAYNALTEYASHRVRVRKGDLLPIRQEQLQRIAVHFASWAMDG